MLVLALKAEQGIKVDGPATVRVLSVGKARTLIGIEADKCVSIKRVFDDGKTQERKDKSSSKVAATEDRTG